MGSLNINNLYYLSKKNLTEVFQICSISTPLTIYSVEFMLTSFVSLNSGPFQLIHEGIFEKTFGGDAW
jgi:hypothetical protein